MGYEQVLRELPSGDYKKEGNPMLRRVGYGRVLRELPSGDYSEEGNPMLGMMVAVTCSMPFWAALVFVLSVFLG